MCAYYVDISTSYFRSFYFLTGFDRVHLISQSQSFSQLYFWVVSGRACTPEAQFLVPDWVMDSNCRTGMPAYT